jgi:hypothetical protein
MKLLIIKIFHSPHNHYDENDDDINSPTTLYQVIFRPQESVENLQVYALDLKSFGIGSYHINSWLNK